VPQFKWITRTNNDIKTADDLRGKTVAVTAGTNTALFVNKAPAATTTDHGASKRWDFRAKPGIFTL
jgi:ABC-type amino acid transport substrate-binding protein